MYGGGFKVFREVELELWNLSAKHLSLYVFNSERDKSDFEAMWVNAWLGREDA